jgi:group I intron endonuclease
MGIIYKLTSPSGKNYIGQSVHDFQKRWKQHISSSSKQSKDRRYHSALSRAIRKYGKDGFKTEILLECDDEHLNMYEESFIKTYSAFNPIFGYNLTSGGDNSFTMSASVKDKMSLYHRKKHGNNLPKYLIKTGCKNANRSGYQITNHPKCKRKRFTGIIDDDKKTLQRALDYLDKLNNTAFVEEKEILPQYVSFMKSRNAYSVQIPRKEGNLRKQFASKKFTKEQNKQMAIQQLEQWKKQYKIL